MKLSIIIPFHNEEKNIEKLVKKILDVMKHEKYSYEIVLVDDNSDDSTPQIIDRLGKMSKIVPIHNRANFKGPTGLGTAIRFGFKNSRGDILIPFMGDFSDDPKYIPELVKRIDGGFDIVCGSRFMKGSRVYNYPPLKMFFNRIYNNLFAFLFFIPVNDISNAFKAYRRVIIEKVKPKTKGFEITSEIILKAHIKNFKITQIPVDWRGRSEKESKFGLFKSPKFLFFKLPKIGYSYLWLSLKLWFKFISSRFF